MRVVITASARSDLRAISRHIAADSPEAARRLVAQLERGCTLVIRDNPFIGSPRDEISAGLRALVVRGYLICYRVRSKTIFVLRVFHGSLDVTRQF